RHHSNKGMTNNFIRSINQGRGKYIAYCEGDDFWLDEAKLQTQVDFLAMHEDYVLTCGGYKTSNGEIVNEIKGQVINGYTFEQTEAIKRWVTKSLTICFRNIPGITDYLSQFSYARDTHLVYYLMKSGKGYYFNLIFGFYNIHEGGAVSKKSKIQRLLIGYEVFNEFYKIENTD